MKDFLDISFRVSKIVQKKRFVKDILQSIHASSGRAILVGGAVRDIFLNLEVKDLDFEIYELSADQLQKILALYGTVSLVGKSFGVFRVHGLDVDWSLPRKDSSGRHPIVQYDPCMEYEQAFIRRDLTINAMGIDMQNFDLIDPFDGLQDLQNKILRAPDINFFVQDPLRLLRVMQFAGRFSMHVDEKLSQACALMDMSSVSIERIEQEFAKLFVQAPSPSIGLRWLSKIGKSSEFLPEVMVGDDFYKAIDYAAQQQYQTDQEKLVIMWAIVSSHIMMSLGRNFEKLHHEDTQAIRNFMRRLSRHDVIIEQICRLVFYAGMVNENLSKAQIKWLALWIAPDISLRLLAQYITLRYDKKRGQFLLHQAIALQVVDQPEKPLLTGKDFLDIAQGVQLGILVKKAYQLQIDQVVTDPIMLKSMVLST